MKEGSFLQHEQFCIKTNVVYLISESDVFSYNGKFTIMNRVYTNKLTDKSSSEYKNMSAEVIEMVCVQQNIVQNKIMLTIHRKHIDV